MGFELDFWDYVTFAALFVIVAQVSIRSITWLNRLYPLKSRRPDGRYLRIAVVHFDVYARLDAPTVAHQSPALAVGCRGAAPFGVLWLYRRSNIVPNAGT